MDAWAIVDTIQRLRALVDALPDARDLVTSRKLFCKRTKNVKELRNSFQHLIGDLKALTQADAPVLGSLSWLRPVDAERRTFAVSIFSPGRFRSIDPKAVVEIDEVAAAIAKIELWQGDKSVNVTKLRAAVADIVRDIETSLRALPPGPNAPCDSLCSVVLEARPEGHSPPDK